MITKAQLLEFSINRFIKFGSRAFTLDELANEMVMSKKTLYNFFRNKEELVSESLSFFVEKIKQEMEETISKETDPLLKIILIYKIGFDYLKFFKPSFIFGLKKYYQKADDVFEAFRHEVVNQKVKNLLKESRDLGMILPNVNIDFVCELYFLRIENIAFIKNSLFETYSNQELLNHLIVYNLRGIVSKEYTNLYMK